MKIQLDIPLKINKQLKIERIKKELNSIAELILIILEERYNDKDISNK